MGFAKAGAAMEEQRVEDELAALGQGPRGIIGDLIGLADDEAVKGVARFERGAAARAIVDDDIIALRGAFPVDRLRVARELGMSAPEGNT